MKHLSILLIFSIGFAGFAQKGSLIEQFSVEELNTASTCEAISFMSPEEKEVIRIMNLVRLYPQKFKLVVAIPYAKSKGMDSGRYYNSLLKDLEKSSGAVSLLPDVTLYNEANSHAKYSGEKGKIGHDGPRGKTYDSRMKSLLKLFREVGENCQYGYNDALDIVMDLLIDEDIPSFGHRKNILNPNFTHVGVSIAPHKKYTYNCATDFGSK